MYEEVKAAVQPERIHLHNGEKDGMAEPSRREKMNIFYINKRVKKFVTYGRNIIYIVYILRPKVTNFVFALIYWRNCY